MERVQAAQLAQLLVEADKKDRPRVQAEFRKLLRGAVPLIHPRMLDPDAEE